MQTVLLENLSLTFYGRQHLKRGDQFEATADDARRLLLLRKCRLMTMPVGLAGSGPRPEPGPEPEPEPDPDMAMADISPRTGRPKRQYRRRDMVPER